MPANASERDRILAILAARTGLVPAEALASTLLDLPGDGSRTVADALEGSRLLEAGERGLLERLVEATVRAHGGDAGGVLAALEAQSTVVGADAGQATAWLGTPRPVSAVPVGRTVDFGGLDAPAPTPNRASGGRFRDLRFHARGGLGEVFIAHDGELDRDVALKRIQTQHADHSGHRARFVVEAEVTGGLEHPGIVPVYSLGNDPDGRPFYAMRFIRGESLEQAIAAFHEADRKPGRDPAERALTLRRLLGRLVDTCQAMAYAHSRGVIHRDLKPSNIMLGKYGETLVVDWGLARSRGQGDRPHDPEERPLVPASGSGLAATEAGAVLGTPAFMSPEQAGGEVDRLGPASDVYSLGATLYALLVGRSPYGGGDLVALLKRVRRGDAPAPRAVQPGVPPALEAVCLKAMALRPEDRYPSALDLADDLEHWLADEPVSAHREPWTIRLSRWRRRHSTLVTAASAVLIAAVAALALGTLAVNAERAVAVRERDRARDEHARAEKEFRRARRAVDDSFTRVSQDVLLNAPGFQPLRKDLLVEARRYYEEFLRDRGDDPSLRAELARTRSRLGEIAESLGERDEALRSYDAAIELWEPLVGDKAQHLPLAVTLDHRGGLLLTRNGGYDRARKDIERAIGLLAPLSREEGDRTEVLNYLAGCRANLGATFQVGGKAGSALPLYREAAAIREGLVRDHPGVASLRAGLARLLTELARIYKQVGPASEVIRTTGRAVGLFEGLHRERPEAARYAFDLSECLADLGRFEFYEGLLKESRDHLDRSEALLSRLVRENPRATLYRVNLGALGNMLADLNRREGRLDLAARQIGHSRELFEALTKEDPSSADYGEALSQVWNITGRISSAEGRRADALAAFDLAAKMIADLPDQVPSHRYNFACNAALGLPMVPADPGRPTPGELAEIDQRARRSIDALGMAVAAGMTNLDLYLNDSDLDPLRGRADFREFLDKLRDLGFPADPFAR